MPDDSYHKCLVSLAYEYFRAGEDQVGLIILNRIPASYYETVQYQQMLDDASYRDLVLLLVYRMIQMGVVQGADDLYVPNQAPAQA